MASPILPTHISFEDWAAQLSPTLSKIALPLPVPVSQWREWAVGVLLINGSLAGNVPIPDPQVYPKDEDWKEWAAKFIQVVYNP